jgi:hypothetical protein
MAGTLRYPFVGPMACGPWTYWVYQCDYVYSAGGGLVPDRYCIDLMDIYNGLHTVEHATNNVGAFVPGDTIYYFFEAVPNAGPPSYFHRNKAYRLGQGVSNQTTTYTEACMQPMEFMILPDAGREVDGDVLYVDDSDDRGGPAEVYFDLAFEDLNVMNMAGERSHGPFYAAFTSLVDIFDVIGPSSAVGNSLASRVQNFLLQLIGDPEVVYQKILWNSGNLSSALVCDGGPPNGGSGPDKSDDWTLLNNFMTGHPNNPGIAFWGDDLAEEWATMTGAGAVAFRGNWMSHIVLSTNHASVAWGLNPSEKVKGDLPESIYVIFDRVAAAPAPPKSDTYMAYGGCALINDFDVLAPTGPPCSEQGEYDGDGSGAVLAQATPRAPLTDARCVLSGHGYNYIRNEIPAEDAPPHVWMDRTEVLWDILTWFQNTYNEPISVDPLAFTNRLGDAYPNPFNPTTTIKYEIKEQAQVTLKVYNVAGQLVRTLVDDVQTPKEGGFTKEWNGLNNQGQPVSSGVYFYKLVTKNFSQTKKMVLLK